MSKSIFCPHCGGDVGFLAPAFNNTFQPVAGPAPPAWLAEPVPTPTKASEFDVPWAEVYNLEHQEVCWKKISQRRGLLEGATIQKIIEHGINPDPTFRHDGSNVIHLTFDKHITPIGGVLYNAVRSMTVTGVGEPRRYTPDELMIMGYALVADEKSGQLKPQLVGEIPVGPIYNILLYWGGDRQHKRWHMKKPIRVHPGRNSCPDFMDNEILAFTAWWDDFDKLTEAFLELAQLCQNGIKGSPPAARITALLIG